MTKKIEILLKKANVMVTAILLEKETPKICEALWSMLPVEREAFHAAWSGECVLINPFGWPTSVLKKPENETIFVGPGEITMLTSEDEVAIFYGRGQLRWRVGPEKSNVFARIVDNLDEFAESCNKMIKEGSQTIIIKKKED